MTSPFLPVAAFSPAIQTAFTKAGWYPGRQALEWDQPEYPPAIRALLLEWGGLTVRAGGYVCFKPFWEDWEQYEREEYEQTLGEIIGRKVCCIGTTTDYWDLLVDEQGLVYILFGACWNKQVGNSFEEGMTRLLTGRG